jgi:hypothetical protein
MGKKQVVFLEPFPEVMFYKISRLLRKKGYEVISIRILENKDSDSFYRDGFDKIISFNLKYFKLNKKNIFPFISFLSKRAFHFLKVAFQILRLSPYAIISRAGPSWPCAITRRLFKKIPLIYFPYDIRSAACKTEKMRIKRGIPKYEIKAERFCFENTEGIMHKGHPDELNYLENELLGYNIELPPNQLSFHPYTSEEFTVPLNKDKLSKDGEIHLIHLDSSGAAGPWGGAYIYDYIRKIIKQGIHVHNYSKSNAISQEDLFKTFEEKSFYDAYKDVLTSKYFHRHKSLDPKKIILEASKYDYGIAPTPEKKNPEETPDLKFTIGNKLATYIEAGIPIILEKGATFTADLVEKYKIGILHDEKILANLKAAIKKIDKKQMEKNILKAREDYGMKSNFPRFEKFLENVHNYKFWKIRNGRS